MTAYVAFLLMVMMNLVSCDSDDDSPEPEVNNEQSQQDDQDSNEQQLEQLNAGSGQVVFTYTNGNEMVVGVAAGGRTNGLIDMEGYNDSVKFELTLDTLNQLKGEYDLYHDMYSLSPNLMSITVNGDYYAPTDEESTFTITSVDRENKTFSGNFMVYLSHTETETFEETKELFIGKFNDIEYQFHYDDEEEEDEEVEDEDE